MFEFPTTLCMHLLGHNLRNMVEGGMKKLKLLIMALNGEKRYKQEREEQSVDGVALHCSRDVCHPLFISLDVFSSRCIIHIATHINKFLNRYPVNIYKQRIPNI